MSENNETNNSVEPETNPSLITDPTTQSDPPADTPPKDDEPSQDEPPAIEPLTADDITFPEDVQVDEELRDEFLSIVNDREKSPREQAQALVDLQLKAVQKASEASSNAWTEMQDQWREEVKADPEIGGDKLQPALGRIGRLVTEYGSEKLQAVFDITGAGNNLEVIKFLDKIAAKLVEGGPVSGAPSNTKTDAASRLFPSMKG